MKKMFYPKLAFSNIRKNAMIYIPYLLTGICAVMFYYIITSLAMNPKVESIHVSLLYIMQTGSFLTGFFALLFLLYTNSFLIKRRKKEIGLYHILGMEKKHIGRVMVYESLVVSGISILLGILAGVLLEKLVLVILLRLISFPLEFGFYISGKAILQTAVLFGVIFLICLIGNLVSVYRSKPIELLHGSQVGEKEPKTKWLLTLIGVITLGIGYGIAIFTQDPLQALGMFLLAVILVMIGTHCLFTAGSITVLKALRKNKRYYYKASHFVSVSGMIYRMKQNAAGLANICILCCAVLVSISTTFSLYVGREDMLRNRYAGDVVLARWASEAFADGEAAEKQIVDTVGQMGCEVTKMIRYQDVTLMTYDNGGQNYGEQGDNVFDLSKMAWFTFIPLEDYNRLTGEHAVLDEGQMLVYCVGTKLSGEVNILGQTWQAAALLEKPFLPDYEGGSMISAPSINDYYCVVKDREQLETLAALKGDESGGIRYTWAFDMTGEEEQKIQASNLAAGAISEYGGTMSVDSRAENRKEFYELYGGMLFLGIFLGIVFALATVLIVYYKQITEGLEDRERFVIMQKVGMSLKEVRKTISSQVMAVFFLPLVVACIHLVVAFPVVCRLLLLFGLTNQVLFGCCMAGCVLVFAIFYGIVYNMTAKVYLKMVRGIEH